ncbi:MAG: PD-(D/E)XK nuclease family protein, partial [Clostridiales bacterium]|nr:PD-(D/E)XK nuclease family protein [Clostridiales bacterium]
ALTFIYGNSGNGKSEYIYHKVADMAEHEPYQHFFIVVPEQFTLKTQRRLVDCSPHHVIMNVDVVSFERLAYRVFDELGIHHTVMEETGKSLVLRRIVEENESRLTILKGNLTKMGYIAELKSVISELMQYGISPGDLEDFLGELKEDMALSFKLRDILHIYRAFDDYLRDDYVTAEKVLEVLMDVAEESELLRGAVFVFDGYTGFTPVQMNLVRRLMCLASDIYVTVTLDVREPLFWGARNAGGNTRDGRSAGEAFLGNSSAGSASYGNQRGGIPARRDPQMQDLFYMSRKMVNALAGAAGDAAFPIAEPVRIEAYEKSRFAKNPVLAHLEQNLFRLRGAAFEGECGGCLKFYSIASPREELAFAAAEISSLVREQGYHYRDFAIVSGNVEGYENYADAVFALYDIPFFADKKQSILYHPLIELVRSVLEMAENNYSYESVFRYLRTGLAGFREGETDLLENYCIEKGIRGASRWKKRFLKPFSRHGRVREDTGQAQEELDVLNGLRERLVYQTEAVVSALQQKDASVRERTEALYAFLRSLSVEEQLRRERERFESEGAETLASSYRQIYKIVIDLFDKMVDLLGGERLSAADYADVLEAGFSAAKVGSIPQGSDCVILGDIERTRLDGVKVLFFLGVNDGLIPKKAGRQSILSQYDREVMEAHRMELAPGEREQMFLQRFYLYLNLTKPSDALYLTYARMDGEGKAVRPSYLIGALQKLFLKAELKEIKAEAFLPVVTAGSSVETWLKGLTLAEEELRWREIASKESGKSRQGRQAQPLRETEAARREEETRCGESNGQEKAARVSGFEIWKALHRWYMNREEWAPVIQKLLDAHFMTYRGEYLEADLVRLLYGTVLVNSVTRLELFARCAFAHFLEYGLKLAERKEFTFESLDMGTMFHAILQKYCTRLEKSCGWDDVTESQQEEILKEAMEEAVLEMPNEALIESSRSAYVLERIYRIMRRSIWAIHKQMNRGDFRPGGYEVEFSRTDTLTPEVLMRTVGSVDRMDLYETDERICVKVVDYKSGNTKFQLLSLYYGKQLQLVLYLSAAMEKLKKEHPDKEVVPAGILYYHLDDPVVEAEGAEPEQIAEKILAQMRPNGLVNREPDIYLHMDRELLQNKKSDVIPVTLKKYLTPGKTGTSAASTEDFELLTEYVGRCMEEEGRQMMEGDINVRPYRLGDQTGCDYCAYRSVCGFDPKVDGYEFKREESLKDEEVWERLRQMRGDSQT